ncbi:MAG TPA: c-type cytochrome [Terriglobia bacterium]|nr:c-type cytochrome [Terriglobia bacterium]
MLSRKYLWFAAVLLLAASTVYLAQEHPPPLAHPQKEGTRDEGRKLVSQGRLRMYPNLVPNQEPAEVAQGKALYQADCSFCHGTLATGGNGGPDLVRSVLVNHDKKGDLIGPVIRNGRVSKGMPKFNLTAAQVSDLAAFLHQRNRDARLRSTYKILNVAVGDAAAGKTFFKEHCSSCHSPTGDLAGIATRYPGDQLQQQWIYPQPGPAPRVTVTLASGRKYSGSLEHIDEFSVSLYDAQGTYRSFPLTNGTHTEVTAPLAAHYRLMKRLTDTEMHNVTTYLESLK